MTTRREKNLAKMEARRQRSNDLDVVIGDLLFRHDPMGIAYPGENDDEYESEAEHILAKLPSCNSVDNARRVIHQEFNEMFGHNIDPVTGESKRDPNWNSPEEKYQAIAEEVWKIWQEREQ